MNTNTKICTVEKHHLYSSYPKTAVPVSLFEHKNSDQFYKTCLDCRIYYRKTGKKYNENKKEKNIISINSGSKLIFCIEPSHINNGSIYPREEIPIEFFRKEPNNTKSELYRTCKNCRDIAAEKHRESREIFKEIALKNNMFYCTNCHKEKPHEENAPNINGKSTLCIDCKLKEKIRSNKLKSIIKNIKMEFISKHECSCWLCETIYLKNNNNNSAIELEVYIINDKKYVKLNDTEYLVKDFLLKYIDDLELSILQFDHLSENEQRELGLLLPDEVFVPKKRNVTKLSSESAIRLEVLKCQLVCARCHVIETIRRENGKPYNSRSYHERDKFDYSNELKLKGCENCGYKNPELPRFFDYDHVDPGNKIKEISRMIKDKNYSLDDFLLEISKCRILCHHCHIIHTQYQLNNGIVNNQKRKTIISV